MTSYQKLQKKIDLALESMRQIRNKLYESHVDIPVIKESAKRLDETITEILTL